MIFQTVEKQYQVVCNKLFWSTGAAVASHYNNLKTTIETRNESRILHLRNFNNFVKSFLINKFSRQVKQELTNNGKFGAIDLGCGKGGDMFKWDKVSPVNFEYDNLI